MRTASIARRSWQSFIGGRGPIPSRRVERVRAGYTLWQRAWASFIGVDLRPLSGAASSEAFAADLTERPETQRRARSLAPGRFELPPLPAVGALSAAGGDSVVLDVSSSGGLTRFLVRRRLRGDGPEYSLELVVSDAGDTARPLLSTVTYRTPEEAEHVLLVPVSKGRFGPAAAYVRMHGFGTGMTWSATDPTPVSSIADWDLAVVAESIDAALNEATRDAWRRVREFVTDEVRGVIDGRLQ